MCLQFKVFIQKEKIKKGGGGGSEIRLKELQQKRKIIKMEQKYKSRCFKQVQKSPENPCTFICAQHQVFILLKISYLHKELQMLVNTKTFIILFILQLSQNYQMLLKASQQTVCYMSWQLLVSIHQYLVTDNHLPIFK